MSFVSAMRGRHASLHLIRLGGYEPEPPCNPSAEWRLRYIKTRLAALRRCRAQQADVARDNARIFVCLLHHGARHNPHQATVLRWCIRHARATAMRLSPVLRDCGGAPRENRRRHPRVTGWLVAWRLAPRLVLWWLEHREVAAFQRCMRCYLALDRSVQRLAGDKTDTGRFGNLP